MTLTFPRVLPCGVVTVEFDIARFMSTNALYGGTTQVREAAEARWKASFTYPSLRRREHQALQAWLDTARGGLRPFLAHDPLKPYPVSYSKAAMLALLRATGGAFDGSTVVATLTAATIYLQALPAGFLLKAGDMVGLVQAGKYGLHRIVEDIAASPAGEANVTVEPRVQTGLFNTTATAQLVRPACLMVLDPGSASSGRSAGASGAITFSGIQALA